MDIEKQLASLERNGIFPTSSSTKTTLIKLITLYVVSCILTYIIKPIYVLQLKYDSISKQCNYTLLKKRFLIISTVNFLCLYCVAYFSNLL
jgi:hypothetical protein